MEDLVKEIITEQSYIIGESLARQMALDTGVVRFNSTDIKDITVVSTNEEEAVEKLINSYENLFGPASVEVCMDVVRKHPDSHVHQYIIERFKNQAINGY
jgi:hypothetical protein